MMRIAVALGFAIIFGAFGDILLSVGMRGWAVSTSARRGIS